MSFLSGTSSFRVIATISIVILFARRIFGEVSYCEMQDEYNCPRHIGCETSRQLMKKNWTDVVQIPIEDKEREHILYIFNSLKNMYANGTFESTGFEKASGFEVIKWNYELETLAHLSVNHVDFGEEVCELGNTTDSVFPIFFEDRESTNVSEFLQDGYERIVAEISKQTVEWFANYFSGTIQMACAANEYSTVETEDISDVVIIGATSEAVRVKKLRCLFDSISEERSEYPTGEPCTECQTKRCTEKYNALCENDDN